MGVIRAMQQFLDLFRVMKKNLENVALRIRHNMLINRGNYILRNILSLKKLDSIHEDYISKHLKHVHTENKVFVDLREI